VNIRGAQDRDELRGLLLFGEDVLFLPFHVLLPFLLELDAEIREHVPVALDRPFELGGESGEESNVSADQVISDLRHIQEVIAGDRRRKCESEQQRHPQGRYVCGATRSRSCGDRYLFCVRCVSH